MRWNYTQMLQQQQRCRYVCCGAVYTLSSLSFRWVCFMYFASLFVILCFFFVFFCLVVVLCVVDSSSARWLTGKDSFSIWHNVLMGMMNPTHSLIHSRHVTCRRQWRIQDWMAAAIQSWPHALYQSDLTSFSHRQIILHGFFAWADGH